MRALLASIESEYCRYRLLAESALAQLTDPQLAHCRPGGPNSVAALCWHVAGNLRSRFTDFLTTDGEKTWRDRESEFAQRSATREELLAHWNRGWSVLFAALGSLSDGDLGRQVQIRGQPLAVQEALHRSLAHTAYHVGQIVFLARSLVGDRWQFLSIPPGASEVYNLAPTLEKAPRPIDRT